MDCTIHPKKLIPNDESPAHLGTIGEIYGLVIGNRDTTFIPLKSMRQDNIPIASKYKMDVKPYDNAKFEDWFRPDDFLEDIEDWARTIRENTLQTYASEKFGNSKKYDPKIGHEVDIIRLYDELSRGASDSERGGPPIDGFKYEEFNQSIYDWMKRAPSSIIFSYVGPSFWRFLDGRNMYIIIMMIKRIMKMKKIDLGVVYKTIKDGGAY